MADGTVPSFTCPNNMSIITGTPASKHGISGNFYLDPATGQAVVMSGPELLRGDTILCQFARAGARVVSITAKDKLRRQLGKNLDLSNGSISFSSEKADQCTMAENGIENVLDFVGPAAARTCTPRRCRCSCSTPASRSSSATGPDLMFLSLTDYVQHKYAPTEDAARSFYQDLDLRFGKLGRAGRDRGAHRRPRHERQVRRAEGKPNVIWLQDVLDAKFGKGDTTVICPITDAFVAHHGALGGFVRVYCRGKATPQQVLDARPASSTAWKRPTTRRPRAACSSCRPTAKATWWSISTAGVCIGGSEKDHDLNGLEGHRLRTHGGVVGSQGADHHSARRSMTRTS